MYSILIIQHTMQKVKDDLRNQIVLFLMAEVWLSPSEVARRGDSRIARCSEARGVPSSEVDSAFLQSLRHSVTPPLSRCDSVTCEERRYYSKKDSGS